MANNHYYVYRDSRTGRFITEKLAAKKSRATWERERRMRARKRGR